MHIVILDGYTENPGDLSWDGFAALGELTVYDRTSLTDEAEIIARIAEAEAVITNKTPLSAGVIAACPSIRYIGVLATGYNVVDAKAAAERGIPVCNVPTYGTMAVAQFAIAMLLEICHHIGHHDREVHHGRWTTHPDFCFWDYPLIELAGKTMGIIGFGRIGRQVAVIAKALGMRILAHDSAETEEGKLLASYVSLEELYAAADVISLHCPLLPATEGMINRESIARMKDGVILLNNARGPLINEQDLADALDSGKVAAAACDVASQEPIRADNPLLTAKNCLLTPHISWAPKESRRRLMETAVANLRGFCEGKMQNRVN
jgi:glycerate dehydrogenase